jgi:hypothetical protein
MGPGLVYDDSTWTGANPQGASIGGTISFGPGGVSGSIGAGAGVGTGAPCGPGTSCGASQNNFALIVIAIAVVVLILR